MERRLVALIGHDDARPKRDEVASRGPLFALLRRAMTAAARDRLHRHPTRFQRRKDIRRLAERRLPFVPVEYGQSLGPNEMRWVDDAQLPINLREYHVEMNGRRHLRHHHDKNVGDVGALEEQARELVDARRA